LSLGEDNFGEGLWGLFLSLLPLSSSSSSMMTISPSNRFSLLVLGDLFVFEDSIAPPSEDDLLFGETSLLSLAFLEEGVDGFFVVLSLLDLDGVLLPSEECFLDLLGVFSLELSTLCFLDLDFEECDSSSKLFRGDFPVGDLENTLSEQYFFADNGWLSELLELYVLSFTGVPSEGLLRFLDVGD